MVLVSIFVGLISVLLLSVIQQFSGATVIRGYVVKMFGAIFHSSDLSMAGGNLSALCECDCATGRVPPPPNHKSHITYQHISVCL